MSKGSNKMDLEILTMSRCQRLLAALPQDARLRVASWLVSAATRLEMPPPPPAVDPRQAELFDGE